MQINDYFILICNILKEKFIYTYRCNNLYTSLSLLSPYFLSHTYKYLCIFIYIYLFIFYLSKAKFLVFMIKYARNQNRDTNVQCYKYTVTSRIRSALCLNRNSSDNAIRSHIAFSHTLIYTILDTARRYLFADNCALHYRAAAVNDAWITHLQLLFARCCTRVATNFWL